jgi:hypothetical protein
MQASVAQELIKNTSLITASSTAGFLILIELVTTITALTHLWKANKIKYSYKIIMTPLFILLPYVDIIYLGYYGIKKVDRNTFPGKIINKIK